MQQFKVGDKVEFVMNGTVVYTGPVVEVQPDDMYLIALDQQDGYQVSMHASRLSLVQ